MGSTDESSRAVALAGYLSLVTGGFADNVRGPLLPGIVATFTATDAQASLLLGIGSLSGVPGSLLAGALIARHGPRAALRASATSLALGLLVVAASASAGLFALVPVGATFLGLGIAGLGVSANYFVASASVPEKRGRALARLHVLYAVASVTVPLVVVESIAAFGWSSVVRATSLAPLSLLVFTLALPRLPPDATRAPANTVPADDLPRSRRVTAVHAVALSLFVVAEVAVSSWFILLAERASVWERPERAGLLVGFFAGMGVARGIAGATLEPAQLRRTIVACGLVTALVGVLGLRVDPAFLALLGAAVGPIFPAAVTALTLELPPARHGAAMGVCGASYSLALALAHTAIGVASDRWGIVVALHLSPLCALVGLAVFWLGTSGKPRASI